MCQCHDQYCESEFSVTIRIVGAWRHNAICHLLELANILIQIDLNRLHQAPNWPSLQYVSLFAEVNNRTLKILLGTIWTSANHDFSHLMNVPGGEKSRKMLKLINHMCIIVFSAKIGPYLKQYAELLCSALDAKKQMKLIK